MKERKHMPAGCRRFLSAVLSAALFAGTAGILGGCRKGFGKDAEGKVKVVATIYPMYDFVKRIGGDLVACSMMVPAGTEPHSWEPSTRDMMMLEETDLFVYNGAGIEAWAGDLLETTQNKKLVAVEASKDVDLLRTSEVHFDGDGYEEEHEEGSSEEGHHHHGEYDPHVWLSPKNAEKEMTAIADALISIDGEHADTYRKNLEEAKKACEELDSAFRESLKPYAGKYIVVAHEAYGYLCRDYGLIQIGIEGVSADQEPDAARMRSIIDMVDKYGIKSIFFEELVDPKVANTIASETGCKSVALSPLDGMSQKDIDAGRDYFSVMKDNLDAIVSSFS